MKRISMILLVLLLLSSCGAEVAAEPLTYGELMRMSEMDDTYCVISTPQTLEEARARYEEGTSLVYATIECIDVRYYVEWDGERGGFREYTGYDVKIIQIHETFGRFPMLEGAKITTYSNGLKVVPTEQLREQLQEHYSQASTKYGASVQNVVYEWIPTADNTKQCLYTTMHIPLNKGERYIALLSELNGRYGINYETPISEDSLFLSNEGYGMRITTSVENIARELVDYVKAKEAE